MLFNPFKTAVQFFSTASFFPNSDDPNAFFPNSMGLDFRKLGKSLNMLFYFDIVEMALLGENMFLRAVEIPCPTCLTWSHFSQDKFYFLVLRQVQMY